jgi:hypothetical protein
VNLFRGAKLGQLRVHDHGVDRLGDLDEFCGPPQLDQHQPGLVRRSRHHLGDFTGISAPEFDNKADDAHFGQVADERAQALVVGRQADPGGEDQLAAP